MAVITVDTDDLVTLTQVAAYYSLTRPAIANWAARYPDFPKPVISTGSVKLYSLASIVEWTGVNQ